MTPNNLRTVLTRKALSLFAALIIGGSCFSAAQTQVPENSRRPKGSTAKTRVFVLGTLYKRHERATHYDLQVLEKLIQSIDADVLVLDVTPKELLAKEVHPGKIEYTQVIFPSLNKKQYLVYPAEPDEPLFSELVNAVKRAHEEAASSKPEDMKAMKQFTDFTYEALFRYWRSPREVNSDTTAKVLAAKKALEAEVVGPVEAQVWEKWNRHWTETIVRAADENPGKTILALTGIENRYWIVDALRQKRRIHLVNLEAWFAATAKILPPGEKLP